MDLPADPGPANQGGSLLSCNQVDTELVHQIAKLLLRGLATACVNNTTGLWKRPFDVAGEMKHEMVDHLTQRSETYRAESAVRGDGNLDPVGETSKDLTEIISDFVNDFTKSKRSLHNRLAGWLVSEKQEDKVNHFVQVMEKGVFWLMDGRGAIAEVLIRNVDFRNMFHCPLKFDTADQLAEHRSQCSFRPVNCSNAGCQATFPAIHTEKHDSECPSKLLPCRQNCPGNIARQEMDSHCATICPMKPVNCPFSLVGCESVVPQWRLIQHCSEASNAHLFSVFQMVCKHEISVEEVKQHVQQMDKSLSEFWKTLDVQSLTVALKEQERKTEKLETQLTKSHIIINGQRARMQKLEHELRQVSRGTNPA